MISLLRLLTRLAPIQLVIWAMMAAAAAGAWASDPILRIEAGRHGSRLNDAATDAAGHLLVTVGADKTARIWSLPGLRPIGVLRPAIGPRAEGVLYAVAVSPDGSLAATAGFRAEVLVFDLQSREIVHRWAELPDSVLALAFSPDGSRLAIGLGTKGIRILRVSDGEVLAEDHDYDGGVYGLAFSRDGRLAASCLDGGLRLYDEQGKRQARVGALAGHRPTHLRFSPDGKFLAVGFNDAMAVEIRNGSTLEPRQRPSVAGLAGRSLELVSWSADGQTLYAGGATLVKGTAPVFAWAGAGAGQRRIVDRGFAGQIAVIDPLAGGGLAVGSLDGDLAVTAPNERRVAELAPIRADFEVGDAVSHPSRTFRLSDDGTRVEWVPLEADPHYDGFDASHLVVASEARQDPSLVDWVADRDGLQVSDWDGGMQPRLNGTQLPLERNERAESVAVRMGRVLVGTQWVLRQFDDNGQRKWQTRLPAPAWRVNQSPDGRLAVAALGDGTLRWYRADNGHELLAVFLTRDAARWVAFTPSGYYAAAPGAEDLIGWHVNRAADQVADFFPASRFRDRYYRPDVVRLMLATLDENAALEQADAARGLTHAAAAPIAEDLPPVVTILSPADGAQSAGGSVDIKYAIRSPSGRPLRAVRVLVDGVAVPDTRGGAPAAVPQPASRDAAALSTSTVTIPANRSVTVAVLAETDSRTSEPAKVSVKGPVPTAAVPPNPFAPRLNAVLIGVSRYSMDELRPGVEYAADDASALKALLEQQRDRGFYREVNTKLVVDGDATRESVVDALDWLRGETTSNDVSLVFMAGHGIADDGRVFFLPVGADPDRATATGLGQADLLSLLGRVVGRKIAFLDFCHAGGAVLAQNTRGRDDMDMVGLLNQMREPGSGLIVFAAATAREPAIQLADQHHGAFTEALLEALAGGADLLRHGVVGTGELNVFITDRVRTLTSGKQHPIMERADDLPDFPLVVTR